MDTLDTGQRQRVVDTRQPPGVDPVDTGHPSGKRVVDTGYTTGVDTVDIGQMSEERVVDTGQPP